MSTAHQSSLQLYTRKQKRTKRTPKPDNLPKYTYGLEGKLQSLIGEPIVLAQRAVLSKLEKEEVTSNAEGFDIRHTYHAQNHFSYVDLEARYHHYAFPWDAKADDTIFHTTIPTVHRVYNFRVDLWEDSEGKLKSFSFALKVM